MTLLQTLQRIFIALDGGLELTDILGPSLAEGSLRLSVALLTLFRGGIYLSKVSRVNIKKDGDIWECTRMRGPGLLERRCYVQVFCLPFSSESARGPELRAPLQHRELTPTN